MVLELSNVTASSAVTKHLLASAAVEVTCLRGVKKAAKLRCDRGLEVVLFLPEFGQGGGHDAKV